MTDVSLTYPLILLFVISILAMPVAVLPDELLHVLLYSVALQVTPYQEQ